MNKKETIGVDIGGTSIKAALFYNNNILREACVKTQAKKGKKAVLENLFTAIDFVFSKNVNKIGIGCPGPFKNLEKGIPGKLLNLPIENIQLKEILKKRYRKKIFVNNDANCFTLAESIYGKGKNSKIVIGVTLGTGFGTGLVINKQIYSGMGNAMEFGASHFDGKTVEDFLGKKAIIKLAKNKGIKIKEPIELFIMANKDKKAQLVWKEYGTILGKALSNLVQTLDPSIIVVGGKISNAWKYFAPSMKNSLKHNCSIKPPKVVKSSLNNSGMIGASLLSL